MRQPALLLLVYPAVTYLQNTNRLSWKKQGVFHVYFAHCDFSGGFFEERGPGREKVLFGVLLQAAVATAHRAIPRHLRRKPLDSNSAASKPPRQNSS